MHQQKQKLSGQKIAVSRGRDKEREAGHAAQEVRDNSNEKQRKSYTRRIDENSVVLPKTPQSKFSWQDFLIVL